MKQLEIGGKNLLQKVKTKFNNEYQWKKGNFSFGKGLAFFGDISQNLSFITLLVNT